MLDVCLVGTGGMMPLPRRWLTALMTRYNGSSLLIDCGEGTQVAIKEKGWSFKPIDVICFTHYHGDHISGLPGLLLTMGNADRTEPLTLIGPRGLERVVNALRVIAPELPFEIRFIEITKPEEVIELNGYRITAFKVNHNVICYGYTLEILRQGKFSPVRAFVIDAAAKINFTAPFTMVGAYAGLAIGDQLKTFVKQGPKILLVGLLVMTGTFLGSCIWDSLILKLTGAI